jgi:hypothetical protein
VVVGGSFHMPIVDYRATSCDFPKKKGPACVQTGPKPGIEARAFPPKQHGAAWRYAQPEPRQQPRPVGFE